MTTDEINFFDNIAATWDEDEIRSTPERIRSILSKVKINPGQKVLDLGTGTGVLIPYLAEAVGEKGQVLGIDVSSGMLRQAIKKFGNIRNVNFFKMDFEEETIDGNFDVIFLYCVLPHLQDATKTLIKLMENNLNQGGKIIIAFPSDENFINNIHKEKKAESNLLPPANILCETLRHQGLISRVVSYSAEEYIVEIKNS